MGPLKKIIFLRLVVAVLLFPSTIGAQENNLPALCPAFENVDMLPQGSSREHRVSPLREVKLNILTQLTPYRIEFKAIFEKLQAVIYSYLSSNANSSDSIPSVLKSMHTQFEEQVRGLVQISEQLFKNNDDYREGNILQILYLKELILDGQDLEREMSRQLNLLIGQAPDTVKEKIGQLLLKLAQESSSTGKLVSAIQTLFDCKRAIIPDLSAIPHRLPITSKKKYKNMILMPAVATANGKADTTWSIFQTLIRLNSDRPNWSQESIALLQMTARHLAEGKRAEAIKSFKQLLKKLRKVNAVIDLDNVIFKIVQLSLKSVRPELTSQALRMQDYFLIINSKRRLLDGIAIQVNACSNSTELCSASENTSLTQLFASQRKNLVSLVARFEAMYLDFYSLIYLSETSISLVDVGSNYFLLHEIARDFIQ